MEEEALFSIRLHKHLRTGTGRITPHSKLTLASPGWLVKRVIIDSVMPTKVLSDQLKPLNLYLPAADNGRREPVAAATS